MKTILLVRHAKSSWDNPSDTDAERPLNEKGKKNAPEMAARLVQRNIPIDAFLSSRAQRAMSTAAFFARAYGKKAGDIITVPELYLANTDAFTRTIFQAPAEASGIAPARQRADQQQNENNDENCAECHKTLLS